MIELRSQIGSLTSTLIGSVIFTSTALAGAPSGTADAQARYRQDMAFCDSGQSSQSLATCRTEARNASAQAKRNDLNDVPGQYERNAVQRCADFRGSDRVDCEARVHGLTSAEGSVEAGAIVRESVRVTPTN